MLGAIFKLTRCSAPFSSGFPGMSSEFHVFLPGFSLVCLDFQQVKHFGGALAAPAPPPSTPLVGGPSSLEFGASNAHNVASGA